MFSRSVLRWLQTLDLSQTYTNPRVDFASGFLVAEIVAKHNSSVSMHSFSNFVSTKMRQDNWMQLLAIFQKSGIAINQAMIDEVIKRKQGAAVKLIEVLYSFYTKRTPCHAQVGEITTTAPKPVKEETTVSDIPPPSIPKPQEPAQPELPPSAPNRHRFIGASSTTRTGSSSDLTPISFESASVVKSGPGFLQLRNSQAPSGENAESKALDTAVDDLTREITPESLNAFSSCITDVSQLIQFLSSYPADMVTHFLKLAAPQFPQEFGPCLIDFLADIFIPLLKADSLTIDDLADFVFNVPSNDPFTHHFLLYSILDHLEESQKSRAIHAFITREAEMSDPLAAFYAKMIAEYANNDPPYLLPSALSQFMKFDRQQAVQLIKLFAPTGDVDKDTALVELYNNAPEESYDHIKTIISSENRAVAAYTLHKIVTEKSLDIERITNLLLTAPDPKIIISGAFTMEIAGEEIAVPPLLTIIDAAGVAESIAAKVTKEQPERIEKEIIVLAALCDGIKEEDSPRWSSVFQQIHDYLYLAFSDDVVCRDVSFVCLCFFRLLGNEVFPTFQVLFKALNYVFPSNCPTQCKQTAAEFLSKAAEITPTFSQTILKLLMNFPPKTHPDLDRLIAALKKVRK